jgi:hypothetical protein
MVPPYGYNSRKNTFLPPYSHAVLTSMGCTPWLAAHFELRAHYGMFSGSRGRAEISEFVE